MYIEAYICWQKVIESLFGDTDWLGYSLCYQLVGFESRGTLFGLQRFQRDSENEVRFIEQSGQLRESRKSVIGIDKIHKPYWYVDH